MHKIFHYELKRLLWNKFFFGLLVVTLFYAYQVFTGEIILGVAHTAPFSPWSFGCYLSRLLPLLWVGELFFLSFFVNFYITFTTFFKIYMYLNLQNKYIFPKCT